MTTRRTQIADAGIKILGERGARAFTHLNIDRELGLPDGSTSYYARSRRDLLGLVVDRLAERTDRQLATHPLPADLTPATAAQFLAAGLEAALEREADLRARLVLLLECRAAPEIYEALRARPPLRHALTGLATDLLQGLGVDAPERHAADLVALCDGLLMQRLLRGAGANDVGIITAYLAGLRGGGV